MALAPRFDKPGILVVVGIGESRVDSVETTGPESLIRSQEIAKRLFERIRRAVIGRDSVIELVVTALFADGHILLEDFPGSGKTTLAKTLGEAIADDRDPPPDASDAVVVRAFRRIQFTPDLLPSDVTGTTVFEPKTGQFSFRPGPVFAHVVLADEINRTSPKVQAAMLEAMAEKQVTVDNQTRPLDGLFFVIATQNPLDLAGTYPLPVAQLDRFLFKVRMTHIDRASELEVLRTLGSRKDVQGPCVTRNEVLWARETIDRHVVVHPLIAEALVDMAQAIRSDRRVRQGVSTRALVLAVPALKTRAMIYGRDYVNAEDLEALVPQIFGHRVELGVGAEDKTGLLASMMKPSIERLAQATLRLDGAPSQP